jgi:hypothetical protein
MKRLLFIMSMLLSGVLMAQENLVLNGGFENVVHSDTCIVDGYAFDMYPWYSKQLDNWFGPRPGSIPRYFNSCDTSVFFGVPSNGFGYQDDANGGHAYVGLITWYIGDSTLHSCNLKTGTINIRC